MRESLRFKPHFNHATGRFYHTAKDYVGDLKKRGLEPYTPDAKPNERKEYKPSQWSRDMINAIKSAPKDANGKPQLGGRFHEALEQRGVSLRRDPKVKTPLPSNVKEGGFY